MTHDTLDRKSIFLPTIHAVAAPSPAPPAFRFAVVEPYTTFTADGKPAPVKYVVDRLMPEGTMSLLIAKPKQAKSSLSRALAVAVSKGFPWLGMKTRRGEVILITLEDPLNHVDNCLGALGWDRDHDRMIHIVQRRGPTAEASLAALRAELSNRPETCLVIIDTMPKFMRLKDIDDYMGTLSPFEELHNIARDYPRVHILAIEHGKKVTGEDRFDSILGSTALRGETNANILLFQENGKRFLQVEPPRQGKAIPPTELQTELIDVAGSDVVKSIALGSQLDVLKAESTDRTAQFKDAQLQNSIYRYVSEHGGTVLQGDLVKGIGGKDKLKFDVINRMIEDHLIEVFPKVKPKTLRLVDVQVEPPDASVPDEAMLRNGQMEGPTVEHDAIREVEVRALVLNQADGSTTCKEQESQADWEAIYTGYSKEQLQREAHLIENQMVSELKMSRAKGGDSYSPLLDVRWNAYLTVDDRNMARGGS